MFVQNKTLFFSAPLAAEQREELIAQIEEHGGQVVEAAATAGIVILPDDVEKNPSPQQCHLYVEELRQFMQAHEKKIRLTECDLRYIDLSGLDLSGAVLVRSNLQHARLEGCNLRGASCTGANFQHVHAQHVRMDGTHLKQADLSHGNFQHSSFRGTRFKQTKIHNANFQQSNLMDAELRRADVNNSDFSGVLRHAEDSRFRYSSTIRKVNESCNLAGLDLRGFDLSKLDLSNANLSGSNLSDAVLSDCQLKYTNLKAAKCSNTNFHHSVHTPLTRWPDDFDAVQRTGVEAVERSFQGRNLKGRDLSALNLQAIDFSNANLCGVNFQQSNLQGCDFSLAKYNASTQWPEGFDYGAQKAIGPNSDLSNQDLSNQSLQNTSLVGAKLNHANLQGANLCGSNLTGASLDACDLKRAQYNAATQWPEGFAFQHQGAIGPGSELSKMDLSEQSIVTKSIKGAQMVGTNLKAVRFHKVDMEGVDCSGANLSGADLSGVKNLNTVNLKGVQWDSTTQWPPGFSVRSAVLGSNAWANEQREALLQQASTCSPASLYAYHDVLRAAVRAVEGQLVHAGLQIMAYCEPERKEIEWRLHEDQTSIYDYPWGAFVSVWLHRAYEIQKNSFLRDQYQRLSVPPLDKDFVHPMKALFSDYSPKDRDSWDSLWKLLTSCDKSTQEQGAVLFETLLQTDAELQEACVTCTEPNLRFAYHDRLFAIHHGPWFLYYLDEDTLEEHGSDYFADELKYDMEMEGAALSQTIIRDNIYLARGVHRILLPLLHKARLQQGKDCEQFLAEAEQLMGAPLEV